jgi:16S rRNA (cytosine967-C5)-methyltransferase
VEPALQDAFAYIETRGWPADRALRRAFRAHPGLDNTRRQRIADAVFGVSCHLRRLDHLLAGVDLPTDLPHRWAAYRVDRLGEPSAEVAAELSIEHRRLNGLGGVPLPADPVERLAVERSLPSWIARVWIEERGSAEADALAAALNRPGPVTLRANTLLNDRGELTERLAQEGRAVADAPLCADGLIAATRIDARGSAAWRQGRFELQDQGSQLIAAAVEAGPGQRVLDLCAGAGGKSLALAAAMADRGALFAADVDAAKLADLRARLSRVRAAVVTLVDLAREPAPLECDRVLVDAPCSALGTWRRGPHRRWDPPDPAWPARQLEILRAGARSTVPGGRLVYATCTLLAAENQAVVDRFLAAAPGFEPVPVFTDRPDLPPGAAVELVPHRHDTDGFFIAAFRRGARS